MLDLRNLEESVTLDVTTYVIRIRVRHVEAKVTIVFGMYRNIPDIWLTCHYAGPTFSNQRIVLNMVVTIQLTSVCKLVMPRQK